MIIQSKAIAQYPGPWCPYARAGMPCRRDCPFCEKARSQARLGQLALVAGDVRGYSMAGFGAFGARSYTTPQVECSVGDFDGKPNGWQNWCDCMFAADDANRKKCRKRPCANPFDPDPDCVFGFTDPALAFAPWTDPGAGVRGIPKEGGGLLYLFGASFAPPSPKELEPDNFFLIADRDPLRAAFLLASSGKVLASPEGRTYPYAIPLWQLQAHYIMMGAPLANIPIVGGVMTAANALQFFVPAGPLSGMMTSAAFQYSMVKDPTGEQFATVIKPVVDARGSDLFNIATGAVSTAFGDPEGLAKLVRVLCKRAARMLPVTGSTDIEVARALLNAAGDAAPIIAKVIKDPEDAFRSAALYEDVGETLKKVSVVAAKAGDKPLADTLLILGDTMKRIAPSLTMVAAAIAEGKPQLLCCGAETAFDLLPLNYMGFKFSTITKLAEDLYAAGATTSGELQKVAFGSDSAKTAMQSLQDGLTAVNLFAIELDKALKTLGEAGKYFSDVFKEIAAQKEKVDAIADAARASNPAAAIANTAQTRRFPGVRPVWGAGAFPSAALVAQLPPLTVFQQGRVVNTNPVPTIPGLPRVSIMPTRQLPGVDASRLPGANTQPDSGAGSGAGVLLAGAGAGFIVGGPVGAVVGAGAALLIGGKK